ncbi:hypothetical protein PENTCL1PPCAC_4594, partial [Pristionchus entomophagus]
AGPRRAEHRRGYLIARRANTDRSRYCILDTVSLPRIPNPLKTTQALKGCLPQVQKPVQTIPPAIILDRITSEFAATVLHFLEQNWRIKSIVDPIDSKQTTVVRSIGAWDDDVSEMSSTTTAPVGAGDQTPSPSSSSTNASQATQQHNRPSAVARPPSTVSEWQLLAILHRANLLQYYDVFIDKGGDDVNQIMCSDESEFLEIMSIVGMLSKPLHVRRLQRALAQYSNDPTAFNLAAIPHIGAPPVSAYPMGLGASDPVQLFNPASLSALTSVSASSAPSSSSTLTASSSTIIAPPPLCSLAATIDAVASVPTVTAPSPNLLMSSSTSPTPVTRTPQYAQLLSSIGGTANVLQGDYLQYLMENNQHSGPSPSPLHDDFVALGEFDPNSETGETPVLSDAQIGRLTACSQAAVAKLSPRAPKLVQNKKKISQDVLDLMAMQPTNPKRPDEFRKFSAIYGRFDAKRKADKALTLHEVSVNEAAAQICMLVPALLTRRDELFTLSRQVVKDAGYHYTKSNSTGLPRSASSSETRGKRMKSETPTEGAASPRSQESASPPLNVVDEDPVPPVAKRAKSSPNVGATKSLLDRWAAERIAKTSSSSDAGGSSSDPK